MTSLPVTSLKATTMASHLQGIILQQRQKLVVDQADIRTEQLGHLKEKTNGHVTWDSQSSWALRTAVSHLVESGCSILSHADLGVSTETGEGWVQVQQEVGRVHKRQHGLEEQDRKWGQNLRNSESWTWTSRNIEAVGVSRYRQVVAAVGANQSRVAALQLVTVSGKSSHTQKLKLLQHKTLLLIWQEAWKQKSIIRNTKNFTQHSDAESRTLTEPLRSRRGKPSWTSPVCLTLSCPTPSCPLHSHIRLWWTDAGTWRSTNKLNWTVKSPNSPDVGGL